MKIHAWKIVKDENGSLKSPFCLSGEVLLYKINEVTISPTSTGIFVFNTREKAREYIFNSTQAPDLKIFKVEVDDQNESNKYCMYDAPSITRYNSVKLLNIRG